VSSLQTTSRLMFLRKIVAFYRKSRK